MIRTTPFHPRLSQLNTQGLYTHWQGHLSALRYTHALKHEYFAVRNGVGIFDTSPLFKYRVSGPDAERLLAGLLARDIRACRPGRAQYSLWCDDRGFVMEDGVVFRHAADNFLLTTARPSLAWLEEHRLRLRVELEDVTDAFGILAVQGPRSGLTLRSLTGAVDTLAPFQHAQTKLADAEATVSRTGYTGDLGYEVTVPANEALPVLDAILEAGAPHAIRPYGEQAMDLLRIEAGLPLVDVEFHNSRLVQTDAERVTPLELGLGWLLRSIDDDTRPFVGRRALLRERDERTSRWATTGFVVDWRDWDRLHREAGLLPPKSEHPLGHESVMYDAPAVEGGTQVGYATSFVYSPVLQRHLGIARVHPDLAAPETPLHLEITVHHHTTTVAARAARMPLFNPARKVAKP